MGVLTQEGAGYRGEPSGSQNGWTLHAGRGWEGGTVARFLRAYGRAECPGFLGQYSLRGLSLPPGERKGPCSPRHEGLSLPSLPRCHILCDLLAPDTYCPFSPWSSYTSPHQCSCPPSTPPVTLSLTP